MSPLEPAHRVPPPAARRQRGVGLVQALLLIVLVGAAVVAGVTLLRSSIPADQAARQEQALRWADEALVAYAAEHARLPCPVASPTAAATACVAAGEKGWLPLRALEAVHPGGSGPDVPLRYMVYRGVGDSDLAVASNAFSPHTWERTALNLDPVNGLDLCAKLATAARETATTPAANRARTTDASGATLNVAYGLVAAGPTPGDAGGRFDGLNQQPGAVVEAPSLGADSRYDDRTRVRGFGSLAETLGCGHVDPANPDGLALAAVDMLGLALDVSDEVIEQHEGNKEDTTLAVAMATVSTVFAGINVALAAASIANSVSTLATAVSQLATATATCAIPPFVACGLIPPYTAAVVAAKVAIGLATGATVLATAAIVPTATALDKTIEAYNMAQQPLAGTAVDLAAATDRACIAAEGGMVSVEADLNGNLVPRDPPVFRPGLRQERDATAAELATLRTQLAERRARVALLEQIPSVELIEYPPAPVRLPGESDADFAAREQAWRNSRIEQETMLQAKLEAIRQAKQAQFDAEAAEDFAKNAQRELASMQESVNRLSAEVAVCDASPPADRPGQARCANLRRALLGMTTCDATALTAQQVRDRLCLPWKREDLDTAVAQREAARATFDRLERMALDLPAPPIKPYMNNSGLFPGSWDCTLLGFCNPLIIANQRDSDRRDTYAKLVYSLIGMEVSLREKEDELAEEELAYQDAKAQCDTLRALSAGANGGGVQQPPVWAGASAIMQAANCRGATGAITPRSCAVTP